MTEQTKSIIAYIFGWIGGLIILLGVKDNTRNTKFHAAQSIVISVATIIIGLTPFVNFLAVAGFIFMILGIIKAIKENEDPKLPLVGDITENLFGKIINGN